MTFVFVTHDQTEALAMSDRVAVMREGRIEQIGPPDTIYAQPVNAYVAGFVGQQNFFDGELTADGHLRTSFGVFRSEHPQNDSTMHSGPGVAAVRPEHLDISTTKPAPGHESLGGQLLGTSHLGETIQYLVRHDGGGTLVVRRPAPNAPVIPTGARVVTSWPRSAARIYPATHLNTDELLVANIETNQHREP
jgi:ABC-type Fe3+/spermidine/putrescine transport system ATPase subunit